MVPVPHPPTSHHFSSTGHHDGAGGCQIQTTPAAMIATAISVDSTIRGQVSTLSAAALRARSLTGSTRFSAQSYCWESRTRPAKIASSPGPGSTRAAMPATTSTQPTVSSATRWAALFMGAASQMSGRRTAGTRNRGSRARPDGFR